MVGSLAMAVPAFADTQAGVQASVSVGQQNSNWQSGQAPRGGPGGMRGPGSMKPGVFGTVSAVNGSTITVNGRQGFGSTAATVSYTVDASNAVVMKNNATSSVSSIAVGDSIFAQGTVTGTNVAATSIRDGVMGMNGMRGLGKNGQGMPRMGTSTPVLGNGQPIVAGTISALNGNTITVTTSSNVTYTVDASNAKILQGQVAASVSNLAVGNSVLVQGTVNGTSVTASTVIDQARPTTGSQAPGKGQGQSQGFFGGIGKFFMHLFGF